MRTTMRLAPWALAAAIVLASCTSSGAGLAGTSWKLTELNGHPPVAAGQAPTLGFEGTDQASGDSGCNSFGGRAVIRGDELEFQNVVSTLRACADPLMNQQEAEFFGALSQTASFQIEAGNLILKDGSGLTILVFAPG